MSLYKTRRNAGVNAPSLFGHFGHSLTKLCVSRCLSLDVRLICSLVNTLSLTVVHTQCLEHSIEADGTEDGRHGVLRTMTTTDPRAAAWLDKSLHIGSERPRGLPSPIDKYIFHVYIN